ncbi:pentatricopeptide repeat-containing protein At3g63370, chloroplastic [Impatiens glandulifera]|uniref:pentatricopeptide repeat-containing protein At3g63370, chloroplastic n=1 Tax=Impatiens glandulifera TaxID=253017 RepID=UPI001FB0B09B|nr:pentatricopeptide repeat-containing protein At3g63370, chloroplastic [Impatiens glandulifera]
MAASVQRFVLNPLPSIAAPLNLNLKKRKKNTIVNPQPHLSKFTQNHIIPLSLKEFSSCSRQEGELEDAFSSLSDFLTQQTPSHFCLDEFYASLLHLCIREGCLSLGQQIHAQVVKLNTSCDTVFLCTKLVFMYGKCGSILNAEKVFDRMPERTVFSWNAIIGGYTTNFKPFRSIELYREMRVSGISLDAHTFPCVIKACGLLSDIHSGAEIHGLSIKLGHASNVIVMNSLVDMYAKCDRLDSAMLIFSNTIAREDVVSWNSLISSYSANGHPNEALKLFIEMLSLGHSLSTYTYVAALQSCSGSSFDELGMQLHASVIKSNLNHDLFVSNALMVMYARLGQISKAATVFKVMDERDMISWNAMLSGFVQNGLYSEALQFWHEMQIAGQKPDQGSVVNMAAASARMGNLRYGMEIHVYAIKNGLDHDLQVGNTLLDMYAKCSNSDYMDSVFNRMLYKDLISWTTIISGHVQNKSYLQALQLFRLVQTREIFVDELMIGSVLQACSGLKCSSLVKEVHGCVIKHEIFDHVLQNTILDAYGACGNVEYASRIFNTIEVLDVVSWTSMMSCYYHNGLANDALGIFFSLVESKMEMDSIAIVSALSSVSSLSSLKKGKEIHAFLFRKGFVVEDSVASSLVEMYASCGDIGNSNRVFRSTVRKDLILWTSMINAYGMHGNAQAAIDLFKQIDDNDKNVVPDHITFLALLYACSHAGLVDEGKKWFDIMQRKYGLDPWPEHYVCLVDILCRANRLEEALDFVKEMRTEPIAAVWSAILGASRVHSNESIGEIAAQKLLELDPNNPSNYVLVSNVLASFGRWDDVEEIRMRMKMKGLKKEPACSWIEIGNKIHTFISRDRSHPQSDEIYRELAKITEMLEKKGGYVAETKFVLHDVGESEKRKMIHQHSERLAIAFGLLNIADGMPIRVSKNLRVCGDCHTFTKLVSKLFRRDIVVRDGNRFHHFKNGTCSCGDFW